MSLLTCASVLLWLQSPHHNPQPGNTDHFVHSLWRGEGSEAFVAECGGRDILQTCYRCIDEMWVDNNGALVMVYSKEVSQFRRV